MKKLNIPTPMVKSISRDLYIPKRKMLYPRQLLRLKLYDKARLQTHPLYAIRWDANQMKEFLPNQSWKISHYHVAINEKFLQPSQEKHPLYKTWLHHERISS